MKVYIVFGSTGEYSDHSEWPVIGYNKEIDAQMHVLKATGRYHELYLQTPINEDTGGHTGYRIPKGANEWDEEMATDYTGTNYTYITVEVLDHLQEVK